MEVISRFKSMDFILERADSSIWEKQFFLQEREQTFVLCTERMVSQINHPFVAYENKIELVC